MITLEESFLLQDLDKFEHGFQDTLNPLCSCGNDVESTEYFLLHWPQFVNERRFLLSTLDNFNGSLVENTNNVLIQTFVFGNCHLVQVITQKFLVLQFILSYQLEYLMNDFFKILKVVSSDLKQANNVTSLIICFLK